MVSLKRLLHALRTALLLLTLFMRPASSFAQDESTFLLTGNVFELDSNTPLPGANVFIRGTTFGSSTSSEGHFQFIVPRRFESMELTVSMIGYVTFSMRISDGTPDSENLRIFLTPSIYNLAELEVVASNREWKKNLERFERLVFSTTTNSRECTIVNPEVLDFEFIEDDGILIASAAQPLIIENLALGYQVILYDASLTGTDHKLKWEGYTKFEELTPRNRKQQQEWEENRLNAYLGSTRHFLAALVSNRHDEEGFQFTNVTEPGQMVDFGQRTYLPKVLSAIHPSEIQPETTMAYLKFEGALLVSYKLEWEPKSYRAYLDVAGLRGRSAFEERYHKLVERGDQLSWLTLNTDSLLIDSHGVEFDKYALERYGLWAWERLAELMPEDYVPPVDGIKD